MKVVIFAGGKGTRLFHKTKNIPKPLIELDDGKPIIWHIMNGYSKFGIRDFIVCLGYKGDMIKSYYDKIDNLDWNIEFCDTGLDTGTAGRIKKIKHLVGDTFLMTYGDGLSSINIKNLLSFHKEHQKILTVTAVRPLIRFGLLDLDEHKVLSFNKNTVPSKGWIDGGFFVCNYGMFDYLDNVSDNEMLEGPILDSIAKKDEFRAFKHKGYWRCVDTYRDLLAVNKDLGNELF